MLLIFFNGTQFFSIGDRSYIYLIMILVLLVAMFKQRSIKKGRIFSKDKIISIVMFFYTLYSIFFIRQDFERGIFLSSLLFFTLMLFLLSFTFSEKDIKGLLKAYIVSALILALGIIIYRYQPYTDSSSSRMTILSYTGEFYDVNFISAYIVIPTILLIDKYLREHRRWNKIAEGILILILLSSIVLTGSRSALALFFIGVIISLFKQKKIGIKITMAAIGFIVIIPAVIPFIPEDIFSHYARGLNVLEDTRRMGDWIVGMSLIADKPLWGQGLVSSHSLIVEKYGTDWVTAHNTYLVFLINYGIVFGLLTVFYICYPLFKMIRYNSPYIYKLCYIMFLISILPIEANFSDIMIIPIGIFGIVANYYKQYRN